MRRLRTTTIGGALLAAALLAGCGGGGGETAGAAPAVTSATATSEAATAPPTAQPATTEPAAGDGGGTTAERPDATATIQVRDGEPVGGTETVKVKKGDRVRIVVRVDAPQELHLHGYDLERNAVPGKPAVFAFTAKLDGIYELESHLQGAVLVKLVVEP
jgi:FtsP/CotA-like multicopper oxidase with cupredoxin domain